MKRPLYEIADEWHAAALALFIDAQQQYYAYYDCRMANYIGQDTTFGGVLYNAHADIEKLYAASERAIRFHNRLEEYRDWRDDRERAERARMQRENRRGMMYPTGLFSRSTDPYDQAMRRQRGRETSRLVGTIVRLSESDPTLTPKGVKELNETMERLVDISDGGSVNPLAILHAVLRHKAGALDAVPVALQKMLHMVLTVFQDFDHPPSSQTGKVPVWHRALWYRVAHKHHTLHPYCAKRNDIPGGIAVAETYARLYAQRFTVMKPGRYLSKYFGHALTEADIKLFAQRQIGDSVEATVYFAKTGDEIVWVYENSPRSCMKMHRYERYIDESLDEDIHPVRAYAHPENNLAVAFIMRDRMAKPEYDGAVTTDNDYGYPPVHARTIVNTQRKCYYRLYGQNGSESALEEALRSLGYVYRADTLAGELLSMQRAEDYLNPDDYAVDREDWAYVSAPYVDGGYCHVVYERTPEGREQLRILEHNDDWVDGLRPSIVQNSSGVVGIYTGKNWFNKQTCRN